MQLNSPVAKIGLIKLDASITPPEDEPAPIMTCISSINSTAPSIALSSFKTPFKRFSKSPRYFVPATNVPKSKENITAPDKTSGTSLSTIRLARPSAIAVLPTPASPTNSGLFLRRLQSVCTVLSISLSRPIRGSIKPASALLFRLIENCSSNDSFFLGFSGSYSIRSCCSKSILSSILEIP